MRVIPKRHLERGFFNEVLAAKIAEKAVSETDDAYLMDDGQWEALCRGQARRVSRRSSDQSATSRLTEAARVAGHALHGAASIAKTSLGIDRASDEQVEARLNVCRECPGGHAVWPPGCGDVHTCGPMIESMRRAGRGTCGCILKQKARDLAEGCPFGWWPNHV